MGYNLASELPHHDENEEALTFVSFSSFSYAVQHMKKLSSPFNLPRCVLFANCNMRITHHLYFA